MGVLLSRKTKVVVQGITGQEGSFWTEAMLNAGTNIVAGVTPGKGGRYVHGIPVYDSVQSAMRDHCVEASVVYVPPRFAKDAAFEAIDAGLEVVVLLVDGLPVHDTLAIRALAQRRDARVIGPNTPGVITVGDAMLGFIPFWLERVYQPGRVGFVSRSGSLTNEVCSHIVASGHGLTSFVGVGGDAAPCTRTLEIVALLEQDPQTEAIVVVGEIGGTMEEELAEHLRQNGLVKPVIAYIAGRTAPPGKRMGHAGAIVFGEQGSVAHKERILREGGALIAASPSEVGLLIKQVLT